MTEVSQSKFTELDQADLERLEQQMEYHKEGAILFFEAVAEIFEREIYLITHKSFKAYCEGRWGMAFRTIQMHLRGESIRKQLIGDMQAIAPEANVESVKVAKALPVNALLELSKVKQEKRLNTLLAAKADAGDQDITKKLIAKTAAKLAHKAIPKPEPEKRRDGFESVYETSHSAPMIAVKGKRVSLEEFRLMVSQGGLNVPPSATFYFQLRGERVQVTSVQFNRNDNELVLS